MGRRRESASGQTRLPNNRSITSLSGVFKSYLAQVGKGRGLAHPAWVDKAPAILKKDAENFLRWCQKTEKRPVASSAPPPPPSATPQAT